MKIFITKQYQFALIKIYYLFFVEISVVMFPVTKIDMCLHYTRLLRWKHQYVCIAIKKRRQRRLITFVRFEIRVK